MGILVSRGYVNSNFTLRAGGIVDTDTNHIANLLWITTNYWCGVSGIQDNNRCPSVDELSIISTTTTTTTTAVLCISVDVEFGCNQPGSDNTVYAGISLFGGADVTYTISVIPNIEFNDYSPEGADPIIVTIPIHTSGGSGSRIANRNNSVESCLSGGTLMPLRICTVSSISISPSGYFYSNAIICTTTTTAPTTTTTTT